MCKWGKHRSVGACAALSQWSAWSRYTDLERFVSLSDRDFNQTHYTYGGSCKFGKGQHCKQCDVFNPIPRLSLLDRGYHKFWLPTLR